ncbi:MAG: FAD-dependent oxidoreductase [bacterium]
MSIPITRNRRGFLKLCGFGASWMWYPSLIAACRSTFSSLTYGRELSTDILIAGGGLGGCAAALAATRRGRHVIMTEPTDWIGGQLTQQGLSVPDEHEWIESFGCTRSYRELRHRIRSYYRTHYALTPEARGRKYLNPGDGLVSRLCHEPRVALAVLQEMLAPAVRAGRLVLLLNTVPETAEVQGDKIKAVQLLNQEEGRKITVKTRYVIDATETGELLPLTATEYVTGSESGRETGEPNASPEARPDNIEAMAWCCAIDYLEGQDNTIEKPEQYDFWRSYHPALKPPWPDHPLLSLWISWPISDKPQELSFVPTVGRYAGYKAEKFNLWLYRRIINQANFQPGVFPSDITILNWAQNDYFLGSIYMGTEEEKARHREGARHLTLSLLYWLQTEAPRPDGKAGWPGLRLRKDLLGTRDGLAKFPYIRESRRIKAEFTILEQHVRESIPERINGHAIGRKFYDSVGVGHYDLDVHPTTGGDNYLDLDSYPYQIPLGALIPRRMENLLAGCKNIGTTHISNGAYRLHHTEWNIGEAAGALAVFCLTKGEPPRRIRNQEKLLREFQDQLIKDGFELDWSPLAGI